MVPTQTLCIMRFIHYDHMHYEKVYCTTKSVINPAAVPLPSSPTHGYATSTSLPNAISTSAAPAAAIFSPANTQLTLPSNKRTQRDRDGCNLRAGVYSAGQLHRDGVEGGIHSNFSSENGGGDTDSRKQQRKAFTRLRSL